MANIVGEIVSNADERGVHFNSAGFGVPYFGLKAPFIKRAWVNQGRISRTSFDVQNGGYG
jgi:hypothetical protein